MSNETPPFRDRPAVRAVFGFGRAPDPVDAAIERHRAAREELQRASSGVDAAMTASQRAEAEAEAVFSAASTADGAAWADLLATRPGDVPGAVRLLRYVSDSPASEIVEDPQDLLRRLTAAVEAAEAGGQQGEGSPAAGGRPVAIEPASPVEEQVDWHNPPPGFMASPAIEPFGFARIPDGIVIELERLRGIALAEFERRTCARMTPEGEERLRRELHLDTLSKAARGEGGFAVWPMPSAEAPSVRDWEAEATRHPGFVPFPAHAPTMFLALDEAIQREAERLLALAEAEIERSRVAYLRGFEPHLWLRVEQDLRREMRMDALALVAAPLAFDDGVPDPVLAAIAASRRAEAEMAAFQNTTHGDQPEAWTARENALCKVQRDALEAVWRTVPTTHAGRRALIDFVRFQVEVHTSENGFIDNARELFEEILAPIAAAIAAERSEPALGTDGALAPGLLVNVVLEAWAALAACEGPDTTDEERAAYERAVDRRDELLDAAEALPATRDAIVAKALAIAWLDHVEEALPGKLREAHTFAGRLAWDIDQAVRRGVAPTVATGPRREHDLSGLPLVQLARLYTALEPFEDLIGRSENAPCFRTLDRTGRTPAGDIVYREAARLEGLLRAIAVEIERRAPADDNECEVRLATLLRHKMLGGLPNSRALLTECMAACED